MAELTRMDCEQVFARLDDFLDRELSAEEMALVRGHLELCAHCASEFDFEAETLLKVRAKVCSVEMPEELKARVAAALRGASG